MMMEMNNRNLLDRFKAGDQHAFDQLFTQLYPVLRVFAYRIVRDEFTGEDQAQESLVKAWHRRDEFQNYEHLRSFLFTSTRNACLNQIEKQRVKERYESTLSAAEPIDDSDMLKDMIFAEVVQRLFAEVDTLPLQCRKVIQMSFQGEKKPQEIADELGISVSTVNSQKMRGLQLLRKKLSDRDFLLAISLLMADASTMH